MATRSNRADSIKSTWREGDKRQWGVFHWLIDLLNAHPIPLEKDVPVHSKDDKIPYLPQWTQHLWVLLHAFIPLTLHQAWLTLSGYKTLNPYAAFILYFTFFNAIVIREIQILRRVGQKYGFLDGDGHERDGVPDVGVGKVVASLFKTAGARMALAIYVSYNPAKAPIESLVDLNWWARLALEIGLYAVVLDFWFYVYHRAMHDVSFLWKFHRTHHLTKHPNALLTAYADHEQEVFDMLGVPFMTYLTLHALGLPLGFYEWWICHQYIVYTEVWGHSGIRVHVTPPTTFAWPLKALGLELVGEDHDLHHRKGYRKSHNYGKQTRVWDWLFGTCHERIESTDSNTDYVNKAYMPIL